MTKVELFDLIRPEHFLQGKSVRQISKQHRIHRRMVREALDPIPPERRKKPKKEPKLTKSIQYYIDHWLQADQKASNKQRHTPHRIFTILVEEQEFRGAEPTIRKYVGRRRRELFDLTEAFIIQAHANGEEAEVDWYEAQIDLLQEEGKYIFSNESLRQWERISYGFFHSKPTSVFRRTCGSLRIF